MGAGSPSEGLSKTTVTPWLTAAILPVWHLPKGGQSPKKAGGLGSLLLWSVSVSLPGPRVNREKLESRPGWWANERFPALMVGRNLASYEK